MAGGLFNRLKVWMKLETVKAADLNGEFDNIIANLNPQEISGYEATVPQMRIQTSPGAQGSESQAISLSDEIERIRYVISRIVGLTYWYDNPNTSLQILSAAVATTVQQNKLASGFVNGDNQPCFLRADTGSNANVRLVTSTPFNAYINNVLVTVSSDLTLALSGPSAFSVVANDATLLGDVPSSLRGENGTLIPVNSASGSAPSSPSFQAFKHTFSGTVEYFFGQYITNTSIGKALRGHFFDHTNATVKRQPINNGDTITLCRAAYIFLTNNASTPALAVTYNEPIVSFTAPTSPSTGDWWLDLATGIWNVYGVSSFAPGNGIFLGIAVMDGSNCVGTRSRYFDNAFSSLNTMIVENFSSTIIQTTVQGARISVYGKLYEYIRTLVQWISSLNLDSGVTLAGNTEYYLYITDSGNQVISDQAPYDLRSSVLGFYHPFKPWRCVGFVSTDVSTNFLKPQTQDNLKTDTIQDAQITGIKLAPSNTAISSSCGTFTKSTAGFGVVTNLIFNFTLQGTRPVMLAVVSDGFGNPADIFCTNGTGAQWRILRNGGTEIARGQISHQGTASATGQESGSFPFFVDLTPGADGATINYSVQAAPFTAASVGLSNMVLMAIQL